MMKKNILALIISIALILMTTITSAQSISIVGLSLNKDVYDIVDTMYITITYILGLYEILYPPPDEIEPYTTAIITVDAFIDSDMLDRIIHTLTYSRPPALTDTLTGYISIVQGIYTLTARVVGTFTHIKYDPIKNTYQRIVVTEIASTITTIQVGTTMIDTTDTTITKTDINQTETTETTTKTTVVVGDKTYTIITWSHRPPHSLASIVYSAPPQIKLASTILLLLLLTLLLAVLLIRRYMV